MEGGLEEESSGVPSPQHQTRHRAHHPHVSRTPDGLEGENMGFLEGAGAIWSSTPLPMDSGQPPACQAQQQGPAGSGRVPSVCPRAGTTSRQRVSRLPPPRLPGSDSAPWNKQSPTMTADTHHSPPGLPSDYWGLGSGSGVGSGVLPWKVLILTNSD